MTWIGRDELPTRLEILLIGRRRTGEVSLPTETAIVLAAIISVVLVTACAATFIWLARQRQEDVDKTRSTIAVASTVLGAPVALGLMLTALTGWSLWLMVLLGIALLLLFLSVRANRRWERSSRLPERSSDVNGDAATDAAA